jgi:hypothetical protein
LVRGNRKPKLPAIFVVPIARRAYGEFEERAGNMNPGAARKPNWWNTPLNHRRRIRHYRPGTRLPRRQPRHDPRSVERGFKGLQSPQALSNASKQQLTELNPKGEF